MSLQQMLRRVLTEYPDAVKTPLEGNPLARFLRGSAADAVVEGLRDQATGLVVQGSPAKEIGRRCHGSQFLIPQ